MLEINFSKTFPHSLFESSVMNTCSWPRNLILNGILYMYASFCYTWPCLYTRGTDYEKWYNKPLLPPVLWKLLLPLGIKPGKLFQTTDAGSLLFNFKLYTADVSFWFETRKQSSLSNMETVIEQSYILICVVTPSTNRSQWFHLRTQVFWIYRSICTVPPRLCEDICAEI